MFALPAVVRSFPERKWGAFPRSRLSRMAGHGSTGAPSVKRKRGEISCERRILLMAIVTIAFLSGLWCNNREFRPIPVKMLVVYLSGQMCEKWERCVWWKGCCCGLVLSFCCFYYATVGLPQVRPSLGVRRIGPRQNCLPTIDLTIGTLQQQANENRRAEVVCSSGFSAFSRETIQEDAAFLTAEEAQMI